MGRAASGVQMPRHWLRSAEVYTIQGNSHGKPCTIPFKYDNQWFHSCTSTGREDGHLWCATTQDYGKDERWGFCPIKSESRVERVGQGGSWREADHEGPQHGWKNLPDWGDKMPLLVARSSVCGVCTP